MPEYLVTMTTHVPDGTPDEAVEDVRNREAARSRQLATQRHLLRLWRPPLQPGELGLWTAADDAEMKTILVSLPIDAWLTVDTVPLSRHPSDPGSSAPDGERGMR